MRFSNHFPKPIKEAPAGEVSRSAILLMRAGYVYKESAGLFTILPLGQKVLQKVNDIVRKHMDELGIQELTMPAMSHIDRWTATGREEIDVLYRVPSQSGSQYVLNATTEELATPLVRQYANSYRDYPIAFYQICNKYRDELRSKSGILRGREFIMKDAYSFHTSEADLDDFYDKVKSKYHDIYRDLGLGDKTVLTYASGGDFTKYSHEYQTLTEIGEDTVYVCRQCNIGINKEIIDDHPTCPECGSSDYEVENGIEVGNIFKLRTRFSEPLGLKASMPDGGQAQIEMASYGVGCTRCIGAIVEIHSDDNGIIWPRSVAPYDIHLVGLGKDGSYAESVYQNLLAKGVSVLFDDRTNVSAGEKFADADLLGMPFRVVASDRLEKSEQVEVKLRSNQDAQTISLEELPSILT